MLSSFIALSAGLIAGVDLSPAPVAVPETPSAAIVREVVRPAPVAREIVRQVEPVSEIAEAPAPAVLIPVQATEPAPPSGTQSAATETAPAPAPAPDPSIVSPNERRAVLKEASNAIARDRTAQGRFVQVDANGSYSEGRFYLQRPGRMRFEYDAPVPILIAADGVTVAMQDTELETVDRVPLASTPLGLLLDDAVDFETDAEVLRVQRANGLVAITVIDPTEQSAGELTLMFNAGTYDLLGWRVLDANNGITSVQLQDIQTGISLNPRLFIIRDDEDEDDDRRR